MAAQEAAQSQQTQGVPESRILQARQANASWLTDPTVFAVNRKPAHSNHRYFLGEATEPKQNLDGEWKVNVTQAANVDVENAPFAAADFNDAGFGAINVPEHLQMAGYLKNKYVNVQYPWDGHEDPQEPNVPENNHVAIYRRSFTLDRPLAATLENGGTVSVTFHGMATAIYVWLNGTFVGYGEDGFTPNEFDITEALHVDGDNVLTVACYEYASASWLEDQDFWRLHGLFRSVELAAQPRVHVETVQIEADYNPSMAAGTLNATLQLRNANDAATVKAKLRDANGTVVWESTQCANETITLNSGALKNIAPWSAEEPTLYELTVLVVGHDGPLVEKVVQRVGFRRFRIEDGIMKLNGKRDEQRRTQAAEPGEVRERERAAQVQHAAPGAQQHGRQALSRQRQAEEQRAEQRGRQQGGFGEGAHEQQRMLEAQKRDDRSRIDEQRGEQAGDANDERCHRRQGEPFARSPAFELARCFALRLDSRLLPSPCVAL